MKQFTAPKTHILQYFVLDYNISSSSAFMRLSPVNNLKIDFRSE